MEEALEVQENIQWATEEEAANPSVLPEDPPVDRSLPVAFRTSSQVRLLISGGKTKKETKCNKCINGSEDKNRLYALNLDVF